MAEILEIKVELEKLHERDLATFSSLRTSADLLGNRYCPSKEKDVSEDASDSLPLLGKESHNSIGPHHAQAVQAWRS